MRLTVTGGCGYIGSALVPHLLAQGHEVTVLDPQWFGNGYLPDNENLTILTDTSKLDECLYQSNAVIWLAGLTNDNECQRLGDKARDANIEPFKQFMRLLQGSKVRRVIFLSSVTVYGNTTEPVHEDHPRNPTTPYGIYKAVCEEILQLFCPPQTKYYILRPAGVCGHAPRMRFDLTINRMVLNAVREGVIHVHGGEQLRPHVHIKDLIDVIVKLLTSKTESGVYNVTYCWGKIIGAAEMVSRHTGAEVVVEPRQDDRSYAVYGSKLARELGPLKTDIVEAIIDMASKLKSGYFPDAQTNPVYKNVVPL